MIFIAKGSGLELHVGVHYRVFSLFFEQFFSFSWPFRMDIFEEYRSVILQNVTLCGFVLWLDLGYYLFQEGTEVML